MNEKERRKSSDLKFLFSYVIVFLLPVMVMLIYFYPAVSRNMNESALIAGKHSLTLLKNSVDTQIRISQQKCCMTEVLMTIICSRQN